MALTAPLGAETETDPAREAVRLALLKAAERCFGHPRARGRLAQFGAFDDKLIEGMVRNVERGRRDPVVQLLVNSDQPALAARVLGGEGVSHQLSYELWRGNSVNAPPMPLAAVAGT